MLQIKSTVNEIEPQKSLRQDELLSSFTAYDLKRLELYAKNMADYHLIMDLVPEVAKLFFVNKLDIQLSVVQKAILLAIGLQRKTAEEFGKEVDLATSQVLGLFNKIMRKANQYFSGILEAEVEKTLLPDNGSAAIMEPTVQSLKQEMAEVERKFHGKQQKKVTKVKSLDLSQYEITGTNEEWDEALGKTKKLSNLSIPSTKEKLEKRKSKISVTDDDAKEIRTKKPKKQKK